jgi:hypothetical protein
MDTEEMYRRGAEDAERDDINPFYYRHYYPYRRGYDETRRRLRRPGVRLSRRLNLSALFVVGVVAALAAWYASETMPIFAPPPPTPTLAVIRPTSTPRPTRTPILPTITPQPTATPTPVVRLAVGSNALVTTAGLRARIEPSTKGRVVASFREGDRVTIIDGPAEADGYIWWKIQGENGEGWSAERSLEGDQWLERTND